MTLTDAMLMLVAACFVAWGAMPFVTSASVAAFAAIGVLVACLHLYGVTRPSRDDEEGPAFARCVLTVLLATAPSIALARVAPGATQAIVCVGALSLLGAVRWCLRLRLWEAALIAWISGAWVLTCVVPALAQRDMI
jgi:hypothetical protein